MTKDTLYAGCNINMSNHKIGNVELGNTFVTAKDSDGQTKKLSGFDGSIPIVTSIQSPTVNVKVERAKINNVSVLTGVTVEVAVNFLGSKLRIKNGLVYGYWD